MRQNSTYFFRFCTPGLIPWWASVRLILQLLNLVPYFCARQILVRISVRSGQKSLYSLGQTAGWNPCLAINWENNSYRFEIGRNVCSHYVPNVLLCGFKNMKYNFNYLLVDKRIEYNRQRTHKGSTNMKHDYNHSHQGPISLFCILSTISNGTLPHAPGQDGCTRAEPETFCTL